MARRKGSSTTGGDKVKKSKDQVKSEIVERTRKMVKRAVARLNAAEVRTSGNPEGNWNLLKAYKAFDGELAAIVTPKSNGNATEENDAE